MLDISMHHEEFFSRGERTIIENASPFSLQRLDFLASFLLCDPGWQHGNGNVLQVTAPVEFSRR